MALVVADAGVLIGLLERTNAHHAAADAAFEEALRQGDSVAVPASALAEALVGPARAGDDAMDAVLLFLQEFPIRIRLVDISTARAAARLRARYGPRLRLPDALVIATAQVLDADRLLTTDRGWPDRDGLRGEIVRL